MNIGAGGYGHELRNHSAAKRAGEEANGLLPAVHRAASLVKRWLLGTHQGSVGAEHLEGYLNEFPLQSAFVAQSWDAVLPAARVGRDPPAGALRRDGQAATTEVDTADAARHARAASKHRARAS